MVQFGLSKGEVGIPNPMGSNCVMGSVSEQCSKSKPNQVFEMVGLSSQPNCNVKPVWAQNLQVIKAINIRGKVVTEIILGQLESDVFFMVIRV